MKLSDFCRNGKEYDKRITKFLNKIDAGGRFLLDDQMGDLRVLELIITNKDGSRSKYDDTHLQLDEIKRYALADILSLANNGGLRGKANIELYGYISGTHLTATFDFDDLVKTADFGGKGKKGGRVNKGLEYEDDLFESFQHYFEGGGPYPDHAKQIIEQVTAKNPGLVFHSAVKAGTTDTSRPLRMSGNNIVISAGGVMTLDMGRTISDITLLFGQPGKPASKEVYLSVKMGDTLSFFNCGVRGGGKDSLSLFPTNAFQTGTIPDAGLKYLNMFGINSEDFKKVFLEYKGDQASSTTVQNHKRMVQLNPEAKRALENLCASGVGYGYWMVHYTGTDLHCYEVSKQYMDRASTVLGSQIEINYGGAGGKGKRIDIIFETQEYEFKFNIRSKSGGQTFPTHTNGDYYKK